MTYDIKISENSIGGRQGWAYVCNSGKIPVLKADLDAEQKYDDYKQYGDVKVAWNYRGFENYSACHLVWDNCEGQRSWEIHSSGCFISGSFGLSDAIELINSSQLPIIRPDDIVAIASYSSLRAVIQLFRVSKVSINCQTVATFAPLTDDEMTEVKKDAIKWCSR